MKILWCYPSHTSWKTSFYLVINFIYQPLFILILFVFEVIKHIGSVGKYLKN